MANKMFFIAVILFTAGLYADSDRCVYARPGEHGQYLSAHDKRVLAPLWQFAYWRQREITDCVRRERRATRDAILVGIIAAIAALKLSSIAAFNGNKAKLLLGATAVATAIGVKLLAGSRKRLGLLTRQRRNCMDQARQQLQYQSNQNSINLVGNLWLPDAVDQRIVSNNPANKNEWALPGLLRDSHNSPELLRQFAVTGDIEETRGAEIQARGAVGPECIHEAKLGFIDMIRELEVKKEIPWWRQLFCRAPALPTPIALQANTQETVQTQSNQPLHLIAGFSEQQGPRPTMEDAHDIYPGLNERFAFYAVYDGHGGNEVSTFVRDNLRPQILQTITQFLAQNERPADELIQAAMGRAIAETEAAIITHPIAGSTASIVLIDKQERIMYCAHLGDSRTVLSSGGCAVPLSRDHKAIDVQEVRRIEGAGGRVFRGRVNGELAVSRAFGDKGLKERCRLTGVMSEPEIRVQAITRDDNFLIIACDGVWDVLSSQEAVDFVAQQLRSQQGDAQQAARELVNHAIANPRQHDNVTAIVVLLR